MADDPKTPATPAGDSGAKIDVDAITKAAVAAATQAATAAVSQAMAPLADQVKALQADLGKVANPEAIAKVVSDQLAASQASQTKIAARQAYVSEKMKDVPAAYLSQLGDDPAKFTENEQAIRTQLKADLAKLGVKAPDVGGTAPGGDPKKATDAVDTSKLSGIELITMGVQGTSSSASAPADKAQATPPATATK